MPQFNYIARDKNGHTSKGIIDSPNRIQATKDLEYQGLIPISIVPVDPTLCPSAAHLPNPNSTDSIGSFTKAVKKAGKGKWLFLAIAVLVIGASIIDSHQANKKKQFAQDREFRCMQTFTLATEYFQKKDYYQCLCLLEEIPSSFSKSSEVNDFKRNVNVLWIASKHARLTNSSTIKVAAFESGTTNKPVIATREDAINVFGQPSGDVSSSDGKTILYYGTSGRVEIQNGQVVAIAGDFSKRRPQPVTATKYPDMSAEVDELSRYVITVANRNNYNWTEAEFRINPGFFSKGYRLKIGNISAGGTYTVTVKDFIDGDGLRFNPETMKVQTFNIHAENPAGRFIFYSCSPQ